MNTKNLEVLLSNYEEKRRRAEMNFEAKKKEIYKKYPELEQIDDKINKLAISKTKAILKNEHDIAGLDIEMSKLKQEKQKIMDKNNIDISFLEPQYECKICKDTGYFQTTTGSKMCNCLKQKMLDLSYDNSNLANIKNDNFSNFNMELFSDKANTEKYKMKCSPRKNIENIKKASIKFIENFDNQDEKNLLFLGNTGLGKTYMTNCIANELLKKGKTVLYQTAPVLLETIIDNKFNKYKNQSSDELYKDILNVDLLIIDDLGTENPNSLTISELFTIINTRILNLNNKAIKTIISTNLSIEQIFKIYEERIGSRIAGYYNIYQFIGEDIRLKK